MAKKSLDYVKPFIIEHNYADEGLILTVENILKRRNGTSGRVIRDLAQYHFDLGYNSRIEVSKDKRHFGRRTGNKGMEPYPPTVKGDRRKSRMGVESDHDNPFGRRMIDQSTGGTDSGLGYSLHTGEDEFKAIMLYGALSDKKEIRKIKKGMFSKLARIDVAAYFKGNYSEMNPYPFQIMIMLEDSDLTLRFGRLLNDITDSRQKKLVKYKGPLHNIAELYLLADPRLGESFIKKTRKLFGPDSLDTVSEFHASFSKLERKLQTTLEEIEGLVRTN